MTVSREISTQMRRVQRGRRHAERVLEDGRLVHPAGPHGSGSTYRNKGCRCVPCTEAHRQEVKVLRHARWASRTRNEHGALVAPDTVRHGNANTYFNWGCQCRPCLDAAATRKRDQTARRVAS